MDFKIVTPHFHQAAIATAFTFSIISPVTSWAALCSTPANPFVVNIATESDDACDDQISLREAITYANRIAGKDAITFADSLIGQTIDATQAGIEITESVSITGPTNDGSGENAELITLKASDDSPLFNIASTADRIDFDLSNTILEKAIGDDHIIEMEGYGGDIVLDNIQTTEATQAGGIFGGISRSNEQEGELGNDLTLTLKNSSISGSIFSDDILDTNSLNNANSRISIEDSTVNNINANRVANSDGNSDSQENEMSIQVLRSNITGNTVTKVAEMYAYYSASDTNISVIESTISGNTITYFGLSTFGLGSGTLNIQDSILCDNLNTVSGDSLGSYKLIQVDNPTDFRISNSKICNNQQSAIGIYSRQSQNTTASIENTIISNNGSTRDGAGIYVYASRSKLDLNIINSSIVDNKSQGAGGGILVYASNESELNLSVSNSTISNNHAGFELTDENVSEVLGGGLLSASHSNSIISMDINNTTISYNTSPGLGGGIAAYDGDSDVTTNIQVNNSIIANNASGSETDHDLLGNFTINNSLIGDLTTNTIFEDDSLFRASTINGTVISSIGTDEGQTPDTGNNILGQDPLLQNLTLSGDTWVYPLTALSPTIAAGNAETENLSEFDQRGEGFARVRDVDGNPQLDMGAVQYFATPVALNDVVNVEQNSENNSITVLDNDSQNSDGLPLDVASVVIMTHPENGSAEALADGSIAYSPNADFFGTDSLVYVVQDIDGNTSSEAIVSITIEKSTADERDTDSDSEASDSSSGGGTLHFWWLSLLAVFGLRRKQKATR